MVGTRSIGGTTAVSVAAGLSCQALAQPASFHGLGAPPSGPSQFVSISADGSTVVGFANRFSSSPHGWRWRAATGLISFGEISFRAEAVSADGAVVAGAWGGLEATRWT